MTRGRVSATYSFFEKGHLPLFLLQLLSTSLLVTCMFVWSTSLAALSAILFQQFLTVFDLIVLVLQKPDFTFELYAF